MTKKQLVRLIRQQMEVVGAAGISIGIMAGIFTAKFLVPYAMRLFGITTGSTEIFAYPLVLAGSIFISVIAILCGMRKPVQMAVHITPVEAVRYTGKISKAKQVSKSKKRGFFWGLALEQLKKERKKTIVVLASLAIR